jgi:cyclopropane fatty-acyl-phospholipid synthase-like methyltransferase
MTDKNVSEEIYDKNFFESHVKNEDTYFYFANEMRRVMNDHSLSKNAQIIDIGCGNGYITRNLILAGYQNAIGIDSATAAQEYWVPKKSFFARDVTEDIDIVDNAAKITKNTGIDHVITSFEVAEHLPADKSDNFVKNLTKSKPALIIFSAATKNQDFGGNPTHINEQPFEYWIDKFENNGYYLHIDDTLNIRDRMMNNLTVYRNAWWYVKNVLIFTPHKTQKTFVGKIPTMTMVGHMGLQLLFEKDHYNFLWCLDKYAQNH